MNKLIPTHGTPTHDSPLIETFVSVSQWREVVRQVHDLGGEYLAMYVFPIMEGEYEVRILMGFAPSARLIRCQTKSHEVPTLVDIIPAVAWDEREIHDRYGIEFIGHEPLRPLLNHTNEAASWTVPVHGVDPYQVAVGPIHAGIIESGHFLFHVVGEKILHVDLRLFYKHRGLEAASVGKAVDDAIKYAQRACAACNVANGIAYAHAAESALGLWPTIAIANARTLLLELERYYNHVNDLAAICAGVGFAPGNMAFAAIKERLHRLNHDLAGHRFLFNTIAVGRNEFVLSRNDADRARRELDGLHEQLKQAWNEMLFNASVQNRFNNVGVLSIESARQHGAVGPTARASGVATDVRTSSPRLRYPNFEPASPERPTGDVAARTELRFVELEQTHELLNTLLTATINESQAIRYQEAHELGVGTVESSRGKTVCVLDISGTRVRSFHLRTSSFANWPALATATATNLLPDFPLINKSFELCYACCDR